ncbi:MAG: imidazole glycerol phosphate synthase subunit HisH, partial [Allorhizobium sp.]
MSSTIVVDYGIGNVFSVCNALRAIGCEAELTGDLGSIRAADRVILPGVGAFARAMDALQTSGISDALHDFVATERPFLGICIGMQLLMDRSSEFG